MSAEFEKEPHASVTPVDDEAKAGAVVTDNEVFAATADGENYRTVSWYRSFALMFKVLFSVGILSIPAVFAYVGALPGALLVIGFGALNTYVGFLLGAFRLRHPGMHGLQDMAYVVGGKWYRELTGILYIIGYILVAGDSYIGVATALNALSDHSTCTVWFSFIAFVFSTLLAGFPKMSQIGFAAWFGVSTLFVSILILVIAVGARDRPALAPATGAYELGYTIVGSPTFLTGMSAALTIFVSSSGTSAFIPIIAEMKDPREYKKPIAASMTLLNVCYLVFSLVIFRYCGTWIASPALGSAGELMEKITYGIALPGLWVSASLCLHLAAKYLFVRILRGTTHLQSKTRVHWATWVGAVLACGIVAFIIAESIPFYGTLVGLVGAIAYAPMAIVIPMHLWLHDFGHYRSGPLLHKAAWAFHVLMLLMGLFMTVGGAYAMIQTIIDSYAAGTVSSAFSCAA
ncbi:hypothetical protein Q5752_007082 [Cryptotrichosporon argae]